MATIEYKDGKIENQNSWPDDKPLLPIGTTVNYKGASFKVIDIIVFDYDEDDSQVHIVCEGVEINEQKEIEILVNNIKELTTSGERGFWVGNSNERIEKALQIAIQSGGHGEPWHNQWAMDQMIRALTGCSFENESDMYKEWVRLKKDGEDGENTYDWNVGIAP